MITINQCKAGLPNTEAGKDENRGNSLKQANKTQEGAGKNLNPVTGEIQVQRGKDPKHSHDYTRGRGYKLDTHRTKTNWQLNGGKHMDYIHRTLFN